MNLINLIVWLSAGAVIGWFARWMVVGEKGSRLSLPHRKPPPDEDKNSLNE